MKNDLRWKLWVGVAALLAVSPLIEKAEAATPLASYFPKQDLVAYAEFDGLDTHGELWRKTAAYRILNETPTGAMLESILVQLAGRIQPNAAATLPDPSELWTLAEHAMRHGFAVGIVRNPGQPRPFWGGLVIRGGGSRGRPATRSRNAWRRPGIPRRSPGRSTRPRAGPSGSKGADPRAAWWQEGDDFALSLYAAEGADIMIETLNGDRFSVTDHPERVALARGAEDFTPIGLAFVDITALPQLPEQAVALGLDRIKQIEYRWGIQGDALMTVTRLVVPAPRSGSCWALFDQPTFDRAGLAALPPGLAGVTAFSVDLGGVYDRLGAGFAASNPAGQNTLEAIALGFRNVTGLRIRDDLLPQLGSKVTYFSLPTPGRCADSYAGRAGARTSPNATLYGDFRSEGSGRVRQDARRGRQEDAGLHPRPVRDELESPAHPDSLLEEHPPRLRRCDLTVRRPAPSRISADLDTGEVVADPGQQPGRCPRGSGTSRPGGQRCRPPIRWLSLNRLPRRVIMASVSDDRRSLLPELIANLPQIVQWGSRTWAIVWDAVLCSVSRDRGRRRSCSGSRARSLGSRSILIRSRLRRCCVPTCSRRSSPSRSMIRRWSTPPARPSPR